MTLENLEDPIEPSTPAPDATPLDVAPDPEPLHFETHPTDDIDKATPTIGERLVDAGEEPLLYYTKQRGARTVDLLLNLPLRLASTPDGGQAFDMHHRMIIEEAVRRQMDATMWAVKALTWKG